MNDMLSSIIRLRLYLVILASLFQHILFFLPASGDESDSADETAVWGFSISAQSGAQNFEEKL